MSELEVTFLGTGTSVGVPMIGCDCAVCTSADPRDRRSRSSILVRSPEASWVVDTGPDFREQCLRERVRELDAVLYTHSHSDHLMGFDDLRRFCIGEHERMRIHARPSVIADLERIYPWAFDGQNAYRGYIKPDARPIEGSFLLGETEVSALPVAHGKVETVGFLFRRGGDPRLAYFPDCKSLGDAECAAVAGVDTLVVDALRLTPHPTHMNFDEALDLVDRVAPRRAFFTHLADEVLHVAAERTLPDRVRVAWDGLRIRC